MMSVIYFDVIQMEKTDFIWRSESFQGCGRGYRLLVTTLVGLGGYRGAKQNADFAVETEFGKIKKILDLPLLH